MVTVEFTGVLHDVSPVEKLSMSNREVQKLTICVPPPVDKLGRHSEVVNFFDVFIYGSKDIAKAWEGYCNDWPAPPSVTVCAQLVGRLKTDRGRPYNNITLRLLKITFNYETEN